MVKVFIESLLTMQNLFRCEYPSSSIISRSQHGIDTYCSMVDIRSNSSTGIPRWSGTSFSRSLKLQGSGRRLLVARVTTNVYDDIGQEESYCEAQCNDMMNRTFEECKTIVDEE